jgi:hypothetical protein
MILAILVLLTAEMHLPAPPSVGTGAGRQEDRREVIFLFGVENPNLDKGGNENCKCFG